jgi:PASTA domain
MQGNETNRIQRSSLQERTDMQQTTRAVFAHPIRGVTRQPRAREVDLNGSTNDRGGKPRILGLFTACLAVAVLTACGGGGGSGNVSDPNVVGQTQAAATTAITGAGLSVGTVTTQASTTVTSGTVISQSPASGTSVAKGSTVSLVVSSGPPTVAAPAVSGDTQSAASSALTGAGLTVGTVTQQSSTTVVSGEVITQSPTAGTSVTVGSAVNLVISSGAVLNGVVASGYAVANGPGYALDAATGTQIPFVTDAGGNYSVNVFGYSGPFLLHVLGVTSGGSPVNIYSLAAASNAGTTVNITPLSDVVLAYAAGITTQSLESTCTANQSACPALLNGILANLATANTAVLGAVPASVLSAFGLSATTFNAITTPFAATHMGVDGLLDALSIQPPATPGGSYAISLVGASPTLLATIPTSGTAGTPGAAPTAGTAPTPVALTQAQNLVAVEGEIQSFFSSVTALFATSVPTAAQVEPLLDPNLLNNGVNAAGFAAQLGGPNGQPQGFILTGGGVGPYSGAQFTGSAPGPALTYDANNCITAIWVYISSQPNTAELTDTIPSSNTAGLCTGGTWRFAGNGDTYNSELTPGFGKFVGANGTTYSSSLQLSTNPMQTTGNPSSTVPPYIFAAVFGPGITTVGAATATTPGLVLLAAPPVPTPPAVLPFGNAIADATTGTNDAYYGGGDQLQTCSAIPAGAASATPCLNNNAVAGSDYTIGFYTLDSNLQPVLLSQQMQRVNVSITGTAIPSSYYPTITNVTPSSSASIAAGTPTTVTTTWTLPIGAVDDSQGVTLLNNATTIFVYENNLSPTATTNVIKVPSLTVAPTSGSVHMNVIIGGLSVGTGTTF